LLFAQVSLDLSPPDLSLSHSMGWWACTIPSYWLRWGCTNFLPMLASNLDPPDFSLPSS
jgi:hypothetical protein